MSLLYWPFDPANAAVVGGVASILAFIGFPLTVWGLRLTFIQARDAKNSADSAQTAADAAAHAVETFRLKLEKFTASNELSQAVQAFDSARRHTMNDAWRDVSDSLEAGRHAMVRLAVSELDDVTPHVQAIEEIANELLAFGNKIDTALSGKGSFPDKSKILPAMRKRHDLLLSLQTQIAKDM